MTGPRAMALAALLAVAMPQGAQAQQGARLWTTAYTSTGACRSFSRARGPEAVSQAVTGYAYPHPKGSAAEFIEHTAAHLNAAAVGRADDAALKARLLAAARGKALTRPDFGAPGGSSPTFVSAVVAINVGYAVSYLRSRNALSAAELKEIADWVATLSRNGGQRAGSRDHKMIVALQPLIWAAAIGDTAGVRKAAGRVAGQFGQFSGSGAFAPDLRNNNEVIQHAVHAALIARLNGFDLLNVKRGKYTLNDVVRLHAAAVQANGSKAVRTSGDAQEQARSIFRKQGWGTHLAWIPAYMLIGDEAGRAAVRALDRALARVDGKPYWGMQMGVHSGCLYGR